MRSRPHVGEAYAAVVGGLAKPTDGNVRDRRLHGLAGRSPPTSATARVIEPLLVEVGPAARDELDRGVTLVGPHRDDLLLRLGTLPAGDTRATASPGRSRSALRLASFELLRADGDDPVLMLDDVFAELDDRAAPGSPSWSPGPSRCWSRPPCRPTCRRSSREQRFDVRGGCRCTRVA